MINASIDYFRRNEKHYHSLNISYVQPEDYAESALDKISADEIIAQVQRLPASYRMVFNLYVIEGYKHDEIASLLDISTGTSKSNLSIARSKLRKLLLGEQGDQRKADSNG